MNTEFLKPKNRLSEIFCARAPMPCCRRQNVGSLVHGQPSRIQRALSVHYKAERPDRSVSSLSGHPPRHIDGWLDYQFTSKQGVQACLHLFGGKPEYHALAAAAPIKTKHQSGLVTCSSKPRRPKAKCPVPPLNSGHPAFSEIACRFPQKRAVGKEPYVTRWRLREDVLYCDAIVLIRHVHSARSGSCILDHASRPRHKIRSKRHLLNNLRHTGCLERFSKGHGPIRTIDRGRVSGGERQMSPVAMPTKSYRRGKAADMCLGHMFGICHDCRTPSTPSNAGNFKLIHDYPTQWIAVVPASGHTWTIPDPAPECPSNARRPPAS